VHDVLLGHLSQLKKLLILLAAVVAVVILTEFFFPEWTAEARHFLRQLVRYIR
jgi:hypothetical protein